MTCGWGPVFALLALLLVAPEKTYGSQRIAPSVNLSPDIFAPGQVVSFLACILNASPSSTEKIRGGDTFGISIGNVGGTVMGTGPIYVDSTEVLPTGPQDALNSAD